MAYTSEELTKSVEKVVRSSIRFQYDSLGIRRTTLSFNDLQDAAAGVFVRFDSAPYYLASIASSRLSELVSSCAEFIDDFIANARATSRYVSPVERLSNLAQARVALDALATASGARDRPFDDIAQVPAYQRFEKNTDLWLSKEGSKVKSGGDIVRAPTEAQGLLRSQARELRAQHDEILRRTVLLMNCISDYEGLNLPSSLAQSIIESSRDVLQDRLDELEALNPDARIDKIRDVTLDVMTTRAAIKGFGSLTPPGLFARITGLGQPYYDSAHPAVPAVLQADLHEPYNFYEGHTDLALVMDKDPSSNVVDVTLQMPGSFVPFVDSFARNPVTLSSDANFTVELLGVPFGSVVVAVPAGTYQIWELVNAVEADLASSLIPRTEAVLSLLGGITTTADAVAGTDIVFRVPSSDDVPLPTPAPPTWVEQGVNIGDLVLVTESASAGLLRSVWSVTSFSAGDYEMSCTLLTGSAAVEDDVTVQIGSPDIQVMTIQVKNAYADTALEDRWVLKLQDIDPNDLYAVGLQATEITARQTTAAAVVEALNTSPTARDALGLARVEAELVFDVDIFSGSASTDPADSTQIYVHSVRGQAVITDVTIGGGLATVTFALSANYDWSSAAPGDTIVIRETEVAGDLNKALDVVSVDPGALELVAEISDVDAPTLDSNILLCDVVPASVETTATGYNFTTLVIDELTGLDGTYEVSLYNLNNPGVVPLASGLPEGQNRTLGGNAVTLSSVQWGRRRVSFKSLDSTLASYMRAVSQKEDVENPPALIPVPNSALTELFLLAGTEAYATTEWFQLAAKAPQVEVGDQLELYNTDPLSPDAEHSIVAGEDTFRILQVSPVIQMPQGAVPFDVNSQVPLGRVRKYKKQNFSEMEALLASWLDRPEADSLKYFRELDAAVNAVVRNRRPTTAQVGTLVSKLQSLQQALTTDSDSLQAALSIYVAKVVEQVDALLKGYRSKGADRAADLLEEGQFSAFFGLSVDGASYGGRLQETMKQAAREMPIRKDNRQSQLNAYEEQLVARYDDVDFEYSFDGAEDVDRIDIPEANDVLPGSLPTP